MTLFYTNTVRMVLDSPIFDDASNRRTSTSHARTAADELTVRWSRSLAVSTLSFGGWEMTGSRITLLSHASSSGETGSGNDVTPSPTSDIRCLRTPELGSPSTDVADASSGNEAEGNETFSLERKRKRKWKRGGITAGATIPINREQPYQQLDDDE